MTYMRSWNSLRLTSHTWLGLNPQIGRPLSRIFVPLVYFILEINVYKIVKKTHPIAHLLQYKNNSKLLYSLTVT
jgi:hypothetical protein